MTDTLHVQGRFFGMTYAEIQSVITNLNFVVETLGSTTENGRFVLEAQGVLQDLADYAEKMRPLESEIESLVRSKEEEKSRNSGSSGKRQNRNRSPRGRRGSPRGSNNSRARKN